MVSSMVEPTGSVDVYQLAHAAVAEFLQRHGYVSTLESFQRDAAEVGWTWEEEQRKASGALANLESLIESHRSLISSQGSLKARTTRLDSDRRSPTDLVLEGPSTLPFAVKKVYHNLHASNILSLSLVKLPVRSFSTAEARYVDEVKAVICSTGADKNIVFCDPATGEMVEFFEGGAGQREQMSHGAAVLCTAQSPDPSRRREFVSCGMDSKVIVWDLLHGKPVQLLDDHSRFVVRCAFSCSGDYLATCSYDRTVCIYRRTGSTSPSSSQVDDGVSRPPILNTLFELVHTVNTRNNPESIVFVRAAVAPDASDPGVDALHSVHDPTSSGNDVQRPSDASLRKRTWLAYTMRSDCFVHYVALPLDADKEDVGTGQEDEVSNKLNKLSMNEEGLQTAAWTDLAFNTNVNRNDLHVSYSLLHLTLHPLGNHIVIQTGDHSVPSTGYASPSALLSRILLMPLLSSNRTTTIWTGVASSGFAANRHAWLPDGSAAWLTSEDGLLRLVDVKGKTRATVQAHGAVAHDARDDEEGELMRTSSSWSRGGNTVIKDVVVLDQAGSVASCGFDHTVRVTSRHP